MYNNGHLKVKAFNEMGIFKRADKNNIQFENNRIIEGTLRE